MSDGLAAILPLPTALAGNPWAVLGPLAGEASLVRVARGMPGAAVVVAAAALAGLVREALAAQGLSAVDVVTVEEPGSRAQCLAAGLQHFRDSPHHVLIHDIRRPLAPDSLRDRVIDALLAGSPIVMPTLAVIDSVKAVDENGSVTDTLDRSTLQAVQYPRGFAVDELSRLLAGRTSEDFDELDEALRSGTPITMVDGDAAAFVVELPRDTGYVEAIIASRQH
ncbi:4-diphosphocytidyl-2-methyl-D-erythritol synthase [Mycobacterium sp. JS623]|uniref:IspD/TarI family cytidylyltransferase n=1 Tax=Mycobacterium sp. JS623 TaxID=212767 RepID=UPI0002A58E26|nr:2-C-methyl-D-erythritol 4-phosphate cytidylyltransferase [Mycobacterium sp. JS623]AGB24673.1 4-diphosphocytidyl-2-methyl-D-erythritol synthase [Mycobacterium sp. JS623]